MKKALLKFLWIYVLYVAVFMLLKPVFMLVYLRHDATPWQWVEVLRHGVAMDFCVAGYLTVVPGLLIMAQLLTRRRWPSIWGCRRFLWELSAALTWGFTVHGASGST